MKIFVIGTRGFPDIQGGVEKHCEILYPLLASEDCLITLFRRKPYVVNNERTYSYINFVDLPSTKVPGFEAFYHSFLCTIISIIKRPDIVHIHNIGPGFFVPFLKITGLKVILTYHSPNYEHVKWSGFTRYFLKCAEFISTKFSDIVIFVSRYQMDKLGDKENFVHINNGVKIPLPVDKDDYLKSIGLQKRKYILAVGRLVEEKGFDLLIRAFSKREQKDIQLVIAGDSDHETAYSALLRHLAKDNDVILPGFVSGEKLEQLYFHSRLFVLPSYNEGQPLALLEAMSYNLPVLASNIPANLQVSLPDDCYFTSGDVESLISSLNHKIHSAFATANYNMTKYDWNQIAVQTGDVYEHLLKKKKRYRP